jgi:hypothetical protein
MFIAAALESRQAPSGAACLARKTLWHGMHLDFQVRHHAAPLELELRGERRCYRHVAPDGAGAAKFSATIPALTTGTRIWVRGCSGPILKGLPPLAQGCEERATLGI